jgi:hypothetical protein
MEETISSFLSMQNALNTRRSQLVDLKNSCTSRTTTFYGDQKNVQEPTYDIKNVDKKIIDINKALFKIDQKIKESNAKTSISIDMDFDNLMSEIA